MGRHKDRALDAARAADLKFIAIVRDANLATLLIMQRRTDLVLWKKLAIDRAVMRHLFAN